MPVDPAAGQQPPRTGDHPYPCSERPVLQIAPWSLQHGWRRTSLDLHPPEDKIGSSGAQAAADGARKVREK